MALVDYRRLGVMYKLALVLSTIPSANVFRAALVGAFHSGHFNDFLVCSGFFHERLNKKGAFYASSALLGKKLPHPSSVTVVGAYDPAATEFDDFVNKLAKGLTTTAGATVPVSQRKSLKKYANRWHAKVFIARKGAHCEFAVIGSSNLTRNAFDASPSNNEADVIIWDDSISAARDVADAAIAGRIEGAPDDVPIPNIFVSSYDADDRRNTSPKPMDQRLTDLWNEVISATS